MSGEEKFLGDFAELSPLLLLLTCTFALAFLMLPVLSNYLWV